jgi:hypothetical protein
MEVQAAYLAENGSPAPRVYEARGAELVMERLDGPMASPHC